MNFKKHLQLEGKHAPLSPSKHHWINYSDDKLKQYYTNIQAAAKGSRLHELAQKLITECVRLPKSKKTFNAYVNDAIGFKMTPEQTLYYSDNAFGTTDAISFRNNKLRIHDLKTGLTKPSPAQLDSYVALFCLEYKVKPTQIDIECRFYYNDEIVIHIPEKEAIVYIMDRIVTFDKIIERLKMGE